MFGGPVLWRKRHKNRALLARVGAFRVASSGSFATIERGQGDFVQGIVPRWSEAGRVVIEPNGSICARVSESTPNGQTIINTRYNIGLNQAGVAFLDAGLNIRLCNEEGYFPLNRIVREPCVTERHSFDHNTTGFDHRLMTLYGSLNRGMQSDRITKADGGRPADIQEGELDLNHASQGWIEFKPFDDLDFQSNPRPVSHDQQSNRRVWNDDQVSRVAALAMKRGKSVDFTGYWQRHVEQT